MCGCLFSRKEGGGPPSLPEVPMVDLGVPLRLRGDTLTGRGPWLATGPARRSPTVAGPGGARAGQPVQGESTQAQPFGCWAWRTAAPAHMACSLGSHMRSPQVAGRMGPHEWQPRGVGRGPAPLYQGSPDYGRPRGLPAVDLVGPVTTCAALRLLGMQVSPATDRPGGKGLLAWVPQGAQGRCPAGA